MKIIPNIKNASESNLCGLGDHDAQTTHSSSLQNASLHDMFGSAPPTNNLSGYFNSASMANLFTPEAKTNDSAEPVTETIENSSQEPDNSSPSSETTQTSSSSSSFQNIPLGEMFGSTPLASGFSGYFNSTNMANLFTPQAGTNSSTEPVIETFADSSQEPDNSSLAQEATQESSSLSSIQNTPLDGMFGSTPLTSGFSDYLNNANIAAPTPPETGTNSSTEPVIENIGDNSQSTGNNSPNSELATSDLPKLKNLAITSIVMK